MRRGHCRRGGEGANGHERAYARTGVVRVSRGSGYQCGTYRMWGRGAVVVVRGGTEGAVRERRGCSTVVVWKDEAKHHRCRVWRDVRGEGETRVPLLPLWSGEARHRRHLAGVWTWTEEGMRMQQGQEGGHVIACGGTDEVGEDDATSSSHCRAVIVVATKWRWSYHHPIALWVTRRARARASLASSSLSSLLRRGGDDGRQRSHGARICVERACGGTRRGQGPSSSTMVLTH